MSMRLPKLLLGMATLAALLAFASVAHAEVKLKIRGEWVFANEPDDLGVVWFVGQGNASHLGKWTCYGEVVFAEGDSPGSLAGEGVVVFRAANGELLVGLVEIEIAPDGSSVFGLHWQDS